MRVLLLGNDRSLGARLIEFMGGIGHVVDWCTSLREASGLVDEPYDAWLIDGEVADGCCIEWLRHMRSKGIAVPAVGIADEDQVSERIRGLDSGADDYLVKPFAPEELCARLRAITRRSAGIADVRRIGPVTVDLTATTASLSGRRAELTAREWAVLEALVRRSGRIVPKGDLEALVLGLGGEVSSNSIEVHVCRLRRKLGRSLIQTVRGVGYRLAD